MEALKILVGCLGALVAVLIWSMTKMLQDKKDTVTVTVDMEYVKQALKELKEEIRNNRHSLEEEIRSNRRAFDSWKDGRKNY